MADDRLSKRAAGLCEQGRKRRGRPGLRWEDCVKRDVRKAGEEEDWKKKTRDRGWKRPSDEAVKKLRAAPHPWQRETRKREREIDERPVSRRDRIDLSPEELCEWFVELLYPLVLCLLIHPHVQLLGEFRHYEERPPSLDLLWLEDVAEYVISHVQHVLALGPDQLREDVARTWCHHRIIRISLFQEQNPYTSKRTYM